MVIPSMKVRSLVPERFPARQEAERQSAARTAVREFFPILLVLVAVDVSTDGRILKTVTVIPNVSEPVPGTIYVYAFLGAGAYAVTSLAFEPKQSVVETYRLTYRLIGALPLGAGVYLLARQLGASSGTTPIPVAGVVFLSGLYVRLTLRRLGDVAERLYGGETGTTEQDQHRQAAENNARQSWRRVATTDLSDTDRQDAMVLLERVEAITGDDDATRQELARARALSERALDRLDGSDAGASGRDGTDGSLTGGGPDDPAEGRESGTGGGTATQD